MEQKEEQVIKVADFQQTINILNVDVKNDFRILRSELEERDKILWEKLEKIEKRLMELEGFPHSETIIVQEMSKSKIKEEVLKFMKEHKISDIMELHQKIKCEIGQLIEIVDELIKEGKIKG